MGGLFTSAIVQLGDEEQQRRWVPDAMSLEVPGAFAMTEIGHGSDVQSLATTATYDPASDEWVIHTPDPCGMEGLPGQRRDPCPRGDRLRTAHHPGGRGPRRPLLLRACAMRRGGTSCPASRARTTARRAGSTASTTAASPSTTCGSPRTNLLNRYGAVDADGVYTSPPIESPPGAASSP